ncbi:hypothetical protein HA075_18885 [bacterium BFN5]|nr:hypothetical protein HA075_18885 [bacterium BFN5]
MQKKKGQQSIVFANPPIITSTANIGGPMEGQGLLGNYFDHLMEDNLNNYKDPLMTLILDSLPMAIIIPNNVASKKPKIVA